MRFNCVHRTITLAIFLCMTAGQRAEAGARSSGSSSPIYDAEYLRLRTELVKIYHTRFTQVDIDEYSWIHGDAKMRRCLELADRILESYPGDPYTMGLKAEFEARLLPAPTVLQKYRRLAAQNPDDPSAHYALYHAYAKELRSHRGRSSPSSKEKSRARFQVTALPHLERAMELDPECFLFQCEHFAATHVSGASEAVEEGLEVLQLIPKALPSTEDPVSCFNEEWRFQYRIARYLYDHERYEESMDLLEDIVKRWEPAQWKPDLYFHRRFSQVFNNLGVCYQKACDQENARHAYLQALELQPDLSYALYNLGYIYAQDGELKEAVKHLEAAASHHRTENLWLLLAQCHIRLGDRESAIRAANQVLEIEPDNEWAREYLEQASELPAP